MHISVVNNLMGVSFARKNKVGFVGESMNMNRGPWALCTSVSGRGCFGA